jgi:selenide,water dikinase
MATLLSSAGEVTTAPAALRLTQYASGGGCACKIPPGELEALLQGLGPAPSEHLIVGLDGGDDAAVVSIEGDLAVVATADFFTPSSMIPMTGDGSRLRTLSRTSTRWAVGGSRSASRGLPAGPPARWYS